MNPSEKPANNFFPKAFHVTVRQAAFFGFLVDDLAVLLTNS